MRPLLQVAVDNASLVEALGALNQAEPVVDVIECGTILILGEGLRCVRTVRALYPSKTIVADVRIAEAGALIARHCFEAGATWVSCVAGASLPTIEQVVKVASEFAGEVQVELGETHDPSQARRWFDLGVKHAIVKRSRDREEAGSLVWGEDDLGRVHALHDMGFKVTITGGLSSDDLAAFAGAPVDVVIAGRSILGAAHPRDAAAELQNTIAKVWK